MNEMLKKILLADSGTGHSEEMLQYLLELPSLQRTDVAILHVVPPQVSAEAMTAKWQDGGKILANAIQKLQLDPNRVTTILRQGEPKDTVCRVAEEVDAELIVMGSRGLKRLESILENSVSQYVFQLASRPMLLVKDDIYVKKLKRIMVALDNSDAARYSLDIALFLLQDRPASELFLLHVDPMLDWDTEAQVGAAAQDHPVLGPAIAQAKKLGISYRATVVAGKPSRQICRLAHENRVDLLLLGSPERRPSVAMSLPDLDRLLGESTSDYVRVHADCPVLLGRMAA